MSLTSFSFLYVWWLLKEPLGSIICSVVAVGRRSLHVSSLSSSSSSVHLLSHSLSFSSYRTFKKLVPHRVVTFGKLKPHHARHIVDFFLLRLQESLLKTTKSLLAFYCLFFCDVISLQVHDWIFFLPSRN